MIIIMDAFDFIGDYDNNNNAILDGGGSSQATQHDNYHIYYFKIRCPGTKTVIALT